MSKGKDIENHDCLIVNLLGEVARSSEKVKVAGFDLDWTLSKTKSFKRTPKDYEDWMPMYDKVTKEKLAEAHAAGFVICVFHNHGADSQESHWMIEERFRAFQSFMVTPMMLIASSPRDEVNYRKIVQYRKPNDGMWEIFLSVLNITEEDVDREESFYCGDDAGRIKDANSDDMLFAMKLKLKFFTPQMWFYDDPINFKVISGLRVDKKYSYEPKYGNKIEALIKKFEGLPRKEGEEQDVIVLMGPPGAGKSTFYRQYLIDYVRLEKDHMKGSDEKAYAMFTQYLMRGKNIVVDARNEKASTRKEFWKIIKSTGKKVSLRLIRFMTERGMSTLERSARCTT